MRIIEYDHFIEGARLDWLHPTNGRWPDLVAQLTDPYKGVFLAAVWWDGKLFVVMVEGPERTHSIIQSYRWVPSGKTGRTWMCQLDPSHMEETTTVEGHEDRIRQIAVASCQLFSTRSS
jgi:hypothetical protein